MCTHPDILNRGGIIGGDHRTFIPALLVVITLTLLTIPGIALAQEPDSDYSPASGHAQVIAQGVVALPAGDALWRTVRTRAPLLADAPFEERPLGFVFASTGPLLLVDGATGEQHRLGSGEAVLVPAGTVQQRASLGVQPVSYLSIELVPIDAAPPPGDATVLAPGQPFPAPTGLHDFDLVADSLAVGDNYLVPDSGAKNVILVTAGAASVGRPGTDPVVLLAGEAASFSGELQVSAAPGGEPVSLLVAMIGPEVAPPAGITETPPVTATEAAAPVGTPEVTGGGSIAIQVFTCPPGMDAATLAVAACAATSEALEISISGANLGTPLTIADAATDGNSFVWSGLPYGDYLIAETTLPAGFSTYVLSARNASGSADTGYQVTISPEEPDVAVRIYNFAPA
jgi:hypothetical protein